MLMNIFLNNSRIIIKHVFNKKKFYDFFSLLLILLIPIFLLFIYYFTYYGNHLEKSINLINNISLISTLPSLLFSFFWLSKQFHNLKYKDKNVIYRRNDFIISYIFISFIWYIFIYFYIIILLMCFINKNIFIFKVIQFGQWFYANLILFITSTTLSIVLIILIKKINVLFLTNAFYLIFALFMSDQFFQYELIANYNFISYISLISPINYSLSLLNNATSVPNFLLSATFIAIKNGMSVEEYIISSQFDLFYNNFFIKTYGLDIFSISNPFCINYDYILKIVFSRWQKILHLIVPYIFSISISPIIYAFYYKNYNLDSIK